MRIDYFIPKDLNDFKLQGNSFEVINRYFLKVIESNCLNNFILLEGPAGVGKTTYAELLKKKIKDFLNIDYKIVLIDSDTPQDYIETLIKLYDKVKYIFIIDTPCIDLNAKLVNFSQEVFFQELSCETKESFVKNLLIENNYLEEDLPKNLVKDLSSLFTDNLRTPLNLLKTIESKEDLINIGLALEELRVFKELRLEQSKKLVENYLSGNFTKAQEELTYFNSEKSYMLFFNCKNKEVIDNFDKYLGEVFLKEKSLELNVNQFLKISALIDVINDLKKNKKRSVEYLYRNVIELFEEAYKEYERNSSIY